MSRIIPGLTGNMNMRDYFAAHASERDIEAIQQIEYEGRISRQEARMIHGQRMVEQSYSFKKDDR